MEPKNGIVQPWKGQVEPMLLAMTTPRRTTVTTQLLSNKANEEGCDFFHSSRRASLSGVRRGSFRFTAPLSLLRMSCDNNNLFDQSIMNKIIIITSFILVFFAPLFSCTRNKSTSRFTMGWPTILGRTRLVNHANRSPPVNRHFNSCNIWF